MVKESNQSTGWSGLGGMVLKLISYQIVTFKNSKGGVQDCSSQHKSQFKWKMKIQMVLFWIFCRLTMTKITIESYFQIFFFHKCN